MNKNIIVNGKIFTGKTTNEGFKIVDEVIGNKNLVILDTKEEYLSKYQKELENNGYDVKIINLNDASKSDCYNVLTIPYRLYKNGDIDTSVELLENLSSIIFHNDDNNMDNFWTNSASSLFLGLVFGLFDDSESKEEVNLASISDMISKMDKKAAYTNYLTAFTKLKDEKSLAYKLLSPTVFSPEDTKGGIESTLRQMLMSITTREKTLNIISKNNIDLGNDNKKCIFVIPGNNDVMATIIIRQLIDVMENTEFVLDNFDQLTTINGMKDILSNGCTKNNYFTIITRDLDNIINKYSNYIEKIVNIINCDTQYEFKSIDKEGIIYPVNELSDLKIFKIDEFVISKFREDSDKEEHKLYNSFKEDGLLPELNKSEENYNIDDLLNKIDEKLEQLDKEESNKD